MNRFSLEELRGNRNYQKIDLLRLYKEEKIYKDVQGFYLFEISKYGELKEGKKFYIEDSYTYIENRVCELYSNANQILLKLEGQVDTQDLKSLLLIDYELLLLISYYTGEEYKPFMSTKQISSWIKEMMDMNIFVDLLQSRKNTPLNSIQIIKEKLGKKFSLKSLQKLQEPFTDFKTTKNNSGSLLQQLPYGMNHSKL